MVELFRGAFVFDCEQTKLETAHKTPCSGSHDLLDVCISRRPDAQQDKREVNLSFGTSCAIVGGRRIKRWYQIFTAGQTRDEAKFKIWYIRATFCNRTSILAEPKMC